MTKKLAVGRRKAVMAGKRSATKRELIEGARSAPTEPGPDSKRIRGGRRKPGE
jgi:hypothetical protein